MAITNEERANSDTMAVNEKGKAVIKRRILDLIDIYDNNPSLQSIGSKCSQFLRHRKLKDKHDNRLSLKSAAARSSLRDKRRQFDMKSLPPKATKLVVMTARPKYRIKGRLKLAMTAHKESERSRKMHSMEEKLYKTKSKNRFRKSEFELLTKLSQLEIKDGNISALTFAAKSENVDTVNDYEIPPTYTIRQKRIFESVKPKADVRRCADKVFLCFFT